ncbi:MAG: Mur ligase family protein, partial [Lysobacteraceae bacterium]
MSSEPFTDSRRLTGSNVYFASTGAALETAPKLAFDDDALERWQHNIIIAREALGWPDHAIVARRHATGASLAFAAPLDQLYTATEVNEWAWRKAIISHREEHPRSPGHPSAAETDSAIGTLRALARSEAQPQLMALHQQAIAHGLPVLIDDDMLSIGSGSGSRCWPIEILPDSNDVDWSSLHDIPTALVTGSNGKTTTVRLLAAMCRASGLHTAYSCTDGVFIDAQALEAGDFSGPTGARTALRQPKAQAAILETARGGILRRGLAVEHADVAVVTNISADHFGEYGIHDLDTLAAVKLTVARALKPATTRIPDARPGLLVLNADDASTREHARQLDCAIGWFARDDDHPLLASHRHAGGATCGVRDGRMQLAFDNGTYDLGEVAAMPLTVAGSAAYNVSNCLGAALGAVGMGIVPANIAEVLAQFGLTQADNPGRLQHWQFGSADAWLDYAHNPDGLRGLLGVVRNAHPRGRLGLILGQAGNRDDEDIRALAAVAAEFEPALVVLKDIEGYARGRESGAVATILRDALQMHADASHAKIEFRADEVQAAKALLSWAEADDVLVLPIHGSQAREEVTQLLDRLVASGWTP